MAQKESKIWEFGDFQTPPELASQSMACLVRRVDGLRPATLIEPTCGVGAFLLSAADTFPDAKKVLGCEIDASYASAVNATISSRADAPRFSVLNADFFKTDWKAIMSSAAAPVAIVGNPPWVTSADIGRLQGKNLPQKSNFQKYSGLEAVTGKANFDISEWMLLHLLEWMPREGDCLAMLCKSSVARKVLRHAWKHGVPLKDCSINEIDAMKSFGAAVDACFFIARRGGDGDSQSCAVYSNLTDSEPKYHIGYLDGMVVSNCTDYLEFRGFNGSDKKYTWRSGIKHDCSKVMELRVTDCGLSNGLGESVSMEQEYLFPMLKSSDLGNGSTSEARYFMLVPQKKVGEDTDKIRSSAPRTWLYLLNHAALLDARGSIIYKKNPRFSIFGVGDYAFSEWKVAISGFYKKLNFQVVGPIGGKATVFDDTVYFISAESKDEAEFLCMLLNSEPCQRYLNSMIFWDEKRPITAELLKRVNLQMVASYLGKGERYSCLSSGSQKELLLEVGSV